jgi:hypothetical protein
MNQENKDKASAIKNMVYYLWAAPIVAPIAMWVMAEFNYRNMRENPYRNIGEIAIFIIMLGLSIYCFHMLAKTVKCPNCEKLYFNGSYKKALFPQKRCCCCGK